MKPVPAPSFGEYYPHTRWTDEQTHSIRVDAFRDRIVVSERGQRDALIDLVESGPIPGWSRSRRVSQPLMGLIREATELQLEMTSSQHGAAIPGGGATQPFAERVGKMFVPFFGNQRVEIEDQYLDVLSRIVDRRAEWVDGLYAANFIERISRGLIVP